VSLQTELGGMPSGNDHAPFVPPHRRHSTATRQILVPAGICGINKMYS